MKKYLLLLSLLLLGLSFAAMHSNTNAVIKYESSIDINACDQNMIESTVNSYMEQNGITGTIKKIEVKECSDNRLKLEAEITSESNEEINIKIEKGASQPVILPVGSTVDVEDNEPKEEKVEKTEEDESKEEDENKSDDLDKIKIKVFVNNKPVKAVGILLENGIVVDFNEGHDLEFNHKTGTYTLIVGVVGYPTKELEVSAGTYNLDMGAEGGVISREPSEKAKDKKVEPESKEESKEKEQKKEKKEEEKEVTVEDAKKKVMETKEGVKVIKSVEIENKDGKVYYKVKVVVKPKLFGFIELPFEEEKEVLVDAQTGEVVE